MKKPTLNRKVCLVILAVCAVLVVLYKLLWADALAQSELLTSWIADGDFRSAMLDTMIMDAAGCVRSEGTRLNSSHAT